MLTEYRIDGERIMVGKKLNKATSTMLKGCNYGKHG